MLSGAGTQQARTPTRNHPHRRFLPWQPRARRVRCHSGVQGPGEGVVGRVPAHYQQPHGWPSSPAWTLSPSVARLPCIATPATSWTRWKRAGPENGRPTVGCATSGSGPSIPDLWERLLAMHLDQHEVELKWVRGHSGNAGNMRADKLAVAAANGSDLPRDEGFENPPRGLI